jgi:serine/threonine protein kinase
MTLEYGSLLNNRFRIVEILGQGGMGSVYRAIDENLGVSVAIKENLFLSDEYARQFRLEANILASLRHPNLPRVGDHFVIRGQGQYLVMDYIEGEDLRQRIERTGPLPEDEVTRIGIAVCDALTYLHTRQPPVIHRDIKPGNVKITLDSDYVLVDFGLAKILDDKQSTTTGARAMTPGYSPPEQYGTARTDERSDIYSLGATLYVALTGEIPEDGLARATGNAQLTEVRRKNPNVTPRLALAIETALELKPADRYQTTEEFRQALLETRENNLKVIPAEDDLNLGLNPEPANYNISPLPVSEVISVDKSRPRLGRRISAFGWFTIIFLAVLIIGGSSLAILQPDLVPGFLGARTTPTLEFPGTAAMTLTPLSPQKTTTHELTPTVKLDLTQTRAFTPSSLPMINATATPAMSLTPQGGGYGELAFVSDRSGKPQIWLMDSQGRNQTQLTFMQDGACQPDWSPDGTRLVFIAPCSGRTRLYFGASLYIINRDGTGLTPLPIAPEGSFDPDWSPDGTQIAFTSLRNVIPQVYVLDLIDNKLTNLSNSEFIDRQPAWSPDGKLIAFVREGNYYQVWLMQSDGSGQIQFTRSGDVDDITPAWTPDGQIIFFGQMIKEQALAWLIAMRLENNGTNREYMIPPTWQPGSSYIYNANVSPDGFWLAYENWNVGEDSHDIHLMTITGANQVQLTMHPGEDFQPIWRPDLP